MKIYQRDAFMKLPAGTLYAKGKPWAFEGLSIKDDTVMEGLDWLTLNPCWVEDISSEQAFERLNAMLETGASFPMMTSFGRDGCFDKDDIFLVFEKSDLVVLRVFVDKAIAVAR